MIPAFDWSAYRLGGVRRAKASGENGDTLVEVLLAIVIIAIAVTAVLAALTTSITSAAEHRSLAADDTLAKSFAETAKDQIEQMGQFVDCTRRCRSDLYQAVVPNWDSATTFPSGYAQYADYSVSIDAIKCIDPTNVGHRCSAATGVEELTIKVLAPNGVSDSLQIIVRKAANGDA